MRLGNHDDEAITIQRRNHFNFRGCKLSNIHFLKETVRTLKYLLRPEGVPSDENRARFSEDLCYSHTTVKLISTHIGSSGDDILSDQAPV